MSNYIDMVFMVLDLYHIIGYFRGVHISTLIFIKGGLMRRYLVTTLLVLFCFSFISLAWAGDAKLDGHNLPWGKSIKEFSNLVLYKTAGGIKYYHNPDSSADFDLTATIKSSRVAYAFKNDKLFARVDVIDTVDDFIKILDQMVELFGEPKRKMDGKTHIVRWVTENLKIKLKFNKDNMSMKMGMYYMPLAGKDFDINMLISEIFKLPSK